MGKRKAKAKPAPKKRMDKLDTVFDCPFCCNVKSVECRIDMKNLIAEAHCTDCKESYSTTATALTEPIDVYSEWIDECERVNNLEDEDEMRSYKMRGVDRENGLEEEEDDIRPYKMGRQERGDDEDDDDGLEDADDIRSYKKPRQHERVDDEDDNLDDEYEEEDVSRRPYKMSRQERVNDLEDDFEDEDEDEV